VTGAAETLRAGVEQADESIRSGKARQVLELLIRSIP
jgi:anthranilate phosphoribosyltransferase